MIKHTECDIFSNVAFCVCLIFQGSSAVARKLPILSGQRFQSLCTCSLLYEFFILFVVSRRADWQADQDFLRVRHLVMLQTPQVTTVLNSLCVNLSCVDTHKKVQKTECKGRGLMIPLEQLKDCENFSIHCSGMQDLPCYGKKQTDVHLCKPEFNRELCPTPSCQVCLLGLWSDKLKTLV